MSNFLNLLGLELFFLLFDEFIIFLFLVFELVLKKIDFLFELIDLSFKAFLLLKKDWKFGAEFLDKIFEGKVGNESFIWEGKVSAGTFITILKPEGNGSFLVAVTIWGHNWFSHGCLVDGTHPLVFEGLDKDVLFAVHWDLYVNIRADFI